MAERPSVKAETKTQHKPFCVCHYLVVRIDKGYLVLVLRTAGGCPMMCRAAFVDETQNPDSSPLVAYSIHSEQFSMVRQGVLRCSTPYCNCLPFDNTQDTRRFGECRAVRRPFRCSSPVRKRTNPDEKPTTYLSANFSCNLIFQDCVFLLLYSRGFL